MFKNIEDKGFDLALLSYARAILLLDFPQAVDELEQALLSFSIPIEEVVASGVAKPNVRSAFAKI